MHFTDKEIKRIVFFSFVARDDDRDSAQKYLKELAALYSDKRDASYELYQGDVALLGLKRHNEFIVIQRGSRMFLDIVFRKFLINELVYEGLTPLIILPWPLTHRAVSYYTFKENFIKPYPNKKGVLLMTKLVHILFIFLLFVSFVSCKNQESGTENSSQTIVFNSETLKIPDTGRKKLRGQVLYMPVYSNIPFLTKQRFDLSAFLAIHNTDLKNKIKITKIDFFNTDGKLIKSFISSDQQLNPLATMIFTIPQADQSGTGANFLVEWMADQQVNEPLVESIMQDLSGNKGLAFLSTGRVIREIN